MKIRPVFHFLPLRKTWIGGITIYPFIFFKRKREEVTDTLFRHELEHIYQVRRLGWFRFYITYIIENIRVGYKNNKYEVEAREAQVTPLTDKERELKNGSY